MASQPEADLFFSPWAFWSPKFMLFEIVIASKCSVQAILLLVVDLQSPRGRSGEEILLTSNFWGQQQWNVSRLSTPKCKTKKA